VSRLSRQCEILNFSQPHRPPRPVTGIALLLLLHFSVILLATHWQHLLKTLYIDYARNVSLFSLPYVYGSLVAFDFGLEAITRHIPQTNYFHNLPSEILKSCSLQFEIVSSILLTPVWCTDLPQCLLVLLALLILSKRLNKNRNKMNNTIIFVCL
jgi:hypothetical protein